MLILCGGQHPFVQVKMTFIQQKSLTFHTIKAMHGLLQQVQMENGLIKLHYSPHIAQARDEIEAGEFTLVLTVNGNGVCGPIQVPKTIQIIDVPVVDLPTTFEVCHLATPFDPVIGFELTPDVLTNFAPSVASTTGVKWSTGGSGFFSNNVLDAENNINDLGDPSNSYSTIYYPSSDDYTNGQVTITLTAYPESPCATATTDTMTLTFTEEPTVNVGGPYSICEDGTYNRFNWHSY